MTKTYHQTITEVYQIRLGLTGLNLVWLNFGDSVDLTEFKSTKLGLVSTLDQSCSIWTFGPYQPSRSTTCPTYLDLWPMLTSFELRSRPSCLDLCFGATRLDLQLRLVRLDLRPVLNFDINLDLS